MENFEWQERLRALTAGETSAEDRARLVDEANASPELKDDLNFSLQLGKVLKNKDLFEVKAIVGGLIEEQGLPKSQNFPKQGYSWVGWIISALFLTLMGTGVFYLGKTNNWWPQDPQTLAQQYLQPLENVVFIEDNESTTVEDLRAGMDAYELQNYSQAILRLNSYYTQTQDANAGLFLAVSHLMKNQPKQALPILLGGLQKNGPVQETSRWYLALAYLQQDDAEAAIRTLQSIPPTSIYGTEAQELLEKLK